MSLELSYHLHTTFDVEGNSTTVANTSMTNHMCVEPTAKNQKFPTNFE